MSGNCNSRVVDPCALQFRLLATRRYMLDNELTLSDLFPRIDVMHTPGHSAGSCCLYLPDDGLLVAGDTLFAGSIGRTDLPGGSYRRIMESLKALCALPPETSVICGHGPATTIEREIRTNPFLADD